MPSSSKLDNRNWKKKPLFMAPKRRRGHWWLLLMVLFIGAVFFLFPHGVSALLAPILS